MRPTPISLLAVGLLATGILLPAASASATGRTPHSDRAAIEQARAERDWFSALAMIEAALSETPRDRELARLRVLTLADIGAVHRAWALYREQPDIFDSAERERLEVAHLARRINWSRLYSENEATRLDEARAAFDAISRFRADAPTLGLAVPPAVRFDELIVMTQLGLHREVADHYERMLEEQLEVPGYALAAVGDSLLALRLPDAAAPVLERAIAADPDNHDLTLQLAYAHLERERFDLARTVLEEAVRAREPWLRAPGALTAFPNWPRYDLEANLALVKAFGEDLSSSRTAVDAMNSIGPHNADLQAITGTVYSLRGWPRRALERFRIAGVLDERNVPARIGQVGALTELQRIDEARPIHDALLARYPAEPRVQLMEREWRSTLGPSIVAHAGTGRSRGGDVNSPQGDRDTEFGVEVRSALFDDRWRLLADTAHRWNDFDNRRIRHDRQSAGLAYARNGLLVDTRVGYDRDGIGKTPFSVDLRRSMGDFWSSGVSLARNAPDASMQARASGIAADRAGADIAFRRHESFEASLSLQHWRYDDGNRRDVASASSRARWVSRPHLRVDLLGHAQAGRASRDDAPYFNPARDALVTSGLEVDRVFQRHYDRHVRERTTVTLGRYWQQGFDAAWVPGVRYGHEWQFAPGRVLLYGVNWSRPVYDGVRETRIGLDAEVRWGR